MVTVRPVQPADLAAISALDARQTGVAKPQYWRDMLAPDRHFLVAETAAGDLAGFVAGGSDDVDGNLETTRLHVLDRLEQQQHDEDEGERAEDAAVPVPAHITNRDR